MVHDLEADSPVGRDRTVTAVPDGAERGYPPTFPLLLFHWRLCCLPTLPKHSRLQKTTLATRIPLLRFPRAPIAVARQRSSSYQLPGTSLDVPPRPTSTASKSPRCPEGLLQLGKEQTVTAGPRGAERGCAATFFLVFLLACLDVPPHRRITAPESPRCLDGLLRVGGGKPLLQLLRAPVAYALRRFPRHDVLDMP